MTYRVPKSHRSKICVIYMHSRKQCFLSFITTVALRQLMRLTVHHMPKCMSCHKGIVVISGRAHGRFTRIEILLI